MTLAQQLRQIERKNAELTARLKLREQLNLSLVKQLSDEKRDIERQHERLRARQQQQLAQIEALEAEKRKLLQEISAQCEATTLMREEIAWLKAQFFGRSSEKSSTDVSVDQRMLFNEAEVLAAIAAADSADATIQIGGHERKKNTGGKVIPARFPREEVAHDLDEAEKVLPPRWHATQADGRRDRRALSL